MAARRGDFLPEIDPNLGVRKIRQKVRPTLRGYRRALTVPSLPTTATGWPGVGPRRRNLGHPGDTLGNNRPGEARSRPTRI